jgi:hypothetical protein
MNKFKPKKKHRPAPWTAAYPRQARRLRPDATAAGGVKARSAGETARMAVYRAIKDVFLTHVNTCQACGAHAVEIHHKKGRASLLLFDVRTWMAVCAACHRAIHNDVAEARRRGWLVEAGEWNKWAE